MDFLLSCRVLGRRVEDGFLHHVLREERRDGAHRARGRIDYTRKNVPVRTLYEANGFREVEATEAGSLWEAGLEALEAEAPRWIRVESSSGEMAEERT